MKILGYRGTSLISHAIRFQTRSIYSHIGMQLADGSVVEAWADGLSLKEWRKWFLKGSVRQIENPFVKHADDTLIDVFRLTTNTEYVFNEQVATKYLLDQIGQYYDYSSAFRFLVHRKATNNEEKFCNELGELACIEGGIRLLLGNPSEHTPRDMLLSPYLVFEETIWKGK